VAKANGMRAARKRASTQMQETTHPSKHSAEHKRREAEKRASASRQVLLQAENRRRATKNRSVVTSCPGCEMCSRDRRTSQRKQVNPDIGSRLGNLVGLLIAPSSVSCLTGYPFVFR
jgi:hypothetical protein